MKNNNLHGLAVPWTPISKALGLAKWVTPCKSTIFLLLENLWEEESFTKTVYNRDKNRESLRPYAQKWIEK